MLFRSPLYVSFDGESLRDHVDIGAHDFYERLARSPALPTTSQPTPRDFADAFAELDAYDRVYALQISSRLSGTYQSAVTAARRSQRGPQGNSAFSAGAFAARGPTVPSRALSDCGWPLSTAA